MQLRGLHVVYADRLVNHPLRRRTEDNGTSGMPPGPSAARVRGHTWPTLQGCQTMPARPRIAYLRTASLCARRDQRRSPRRVQRPSASAAQGPTPRAGPCLSASGPIPWYRRWGDQRDRVNGRDELPVRSAVVAALAVLCRVGSGKEGMTAEGFTRPSSPGRSKGRSPLSSRRRCRRG